MVILRNILTLDGEVVDREIRGDSDRVVDGESRLTFMPAIAAPYTKMTQGLSAVAFKAGVATLFITNSDGRGWRSVDEGKKAAEELLPLHCRCYLSADAENLEELLRAAGKIAALKVSASQLGSNEYERAFQLAAQTNIMAAVDAAEEGVEVVEKALATAEKYGTELCLLQVSSSSELAMIAEAKGREVLVYCGADADILFDEGPKSDALWKDVTTKNVDFVGGSLDLLLPKFLRAVGQGKLSIERVVALANLSIMNIFRLSRISDYLLVDLKDEKVCYTIIEGKVFEC